MNRNPIYSSHKQTRKDESNMVQKHWPVALDVMSNARSTIYIKDRSKAVEFIEFKI